MIEIKVPLINIIKIIIGGKSKIFLGQIDEGERVDIDYFEYTNPGDCEKWGGSCVSDPLSHCNSNDIILDGYCSGISKCCISNNKEKESVLDFVYVLENSSYNDSKDTKTSISDFRSALSHLPWWIRKTGHSGSKIYYSHRK